MPQPKKLGDRRQRWNENSGYELTPERKAKKAEWAQRHRAKKKLKESEDNKLTKREEGLPGLSLTQAKVLLATAGYAKEPLGAKPWLVSIASVSGVSGIGEVGRLVTQLRNRGLVELIDDSIAISYADASWMIFGVTDQGWQLLQENKESHS